MLRLQHEIYDRLVYRKLRAAVGGRVRYSVSGGGALGKGSATSSAVRGSLIIEGYGLTETTADRRP